jgi:hypothetical protein
MGQVNFPCGHCGNLMGVLEHLLGQQVRCPHCQQVVRAPASAGPPPPAPPDLQATTFAVPPPVEPESIFTPPEATDDDLFGGSPPPRLELPPEPTWAPPPPAPETPPPEPMAAPPAPPMEPTLTYMPRGEGTAPENPGGVATLTAPSTEAAPADESALPAMPSPAVARARRGGGGWVVPVLLVPLLLYSVLATIAVIYLIALLYQQPQRSPFDALPDQGEHPGASHVQLKFGRTPLLELPARLRVGLGQSLTVGDLKVTPKSAELRRVKLRVEKYKPDESTDECLCVFLELENVSSDVVFRPLDAFFFQKWTAKAEENVPFTYLEGSDHRRFYGGAYEGILPGKRDVNRVVVEGQDYDRELRPGQKATTFVCTDPDVHVGKYLASYRGPLVYRIRLRRGLVPYRDKEVSATTVIGVEFSSQDVIPRDTPAG